MANPEPATDHLNVGGNEGNKYGAGRKPDEWKRACAELASNDEILAKAKEVLKDPSHGAWLGAWKWLGEQAYGKAKETIDLSAASAETLLEALKKESK